jgi:hypothetical protein
VARVESENNGVRGGDNDEDDVNDGDSDDESAGTKTVSSELI